MGEGEMSEGGFVGPRRPGRRAVALLAVIPLLGALFALAPPAAADVDPVAAALVTEPLASTMPALTALATTTATSVQSFDTSNDLTPLSTDPSGLTWMPDRDRLLMADSEIIERDSYGGANLWLLTPQAPPVRTADGETAAWSEEPTGISYDADNGRVFTADDDDHAIYEVHVGADGIPGTADDVFVRSIPLTGDTGHPHRDPEGVAYDAERGWLYVAGGSARNVITIKPGEDGTFQGDGAGSDDTFDYIDVGADGIRDPEGIAYNAETDTVTVIDYRDTTAAEYDVDGEFRRFVDLTTPGLVHPAGGTWAPASNGGAEPNLWVVDRGLDGDERDGKLFEFDVPPLDGAPTAPEIELDPTSLPLAAHAGTDVEGDVTVENGGTAPLVVSSTTVGGADAGLFSIVSGGSSFTVEPGDTHTIGVRFSPTSVGSFSASLDLESNDPDDPTASVALSGTGTLAPVPDVTVSPESVSFSTLNLAQSAERVVTVTNDGTSSLSVTKTSLGSSGADQFSIVSGGGSYSLEPGEGREVTVRFSPDTVGSHSASLILETNDPDEESTVVELSGTGVEPDVSVTPSPGTGVVGEVSVTPSSVSFSSVEVGLSAEVDVEIANRGDGELTVTSATVSGADADRFSIDPANGTFTLEGGESRTVTVRFTPNAAASFSASLDVASDDPDEGLVSVVLTGTGAEGLPAGVPEPRSIDPACTIPGGFEDGFTDVSGENVHEAAIDCIVYWQISDGVRPGAYDPGSGVTRGQMASFIARFIERTGGDIPADPDDAFPDDDGHTHEQSINDLAAAGVVTGRSDGTFGPDLTVRRSQMATFIMRALEHVFGGEVAHEVPVTDFFDDDDGDTHEGNINEAAATGVTAGTGGSSFSPHQPVRRDQMGSFIARALAVLVDAEAASIPDPPS